MAKVRVNHLLDKIPLITQNVRGLIWNPNDAIISNAKSYCQKSPMNLLNDIEFVGSFRKVV